VTTWTTVPLGDVADLQAGAGFPPSMQGRLEGELPLAKVGDISRAVRAGGYALIAPLHHITKAEAAELRARIFPAGSTVFAKIGEAISQNYRLLTDREAAFDNNVMGAIPRAGRIDARYLFRFLQTLDLYAYSSKTTVPALRKSDLERIPVPVPDGATQRRIADILDKADAIRRKRKEAIGLTEELLRSAFLEMVGPQATGYLGWPEATFESLAAPGPGTMRTGPFGSDLRHSEFVDEGVAVLGIDNAVQNRFAWDERRYITHQKYDGLKRYTVRPHDVIVTIMGTTGRSAVVPDDIPLAITTKHLATITVNRELAEPEFISQAIHRHPGVLAQIHQANRGAIMSGLNLGLIKSLVVRCPPIQRQRRFTEFTQRVRLTAEQLQIASGDVELLFNALVDRAFRGELTGTNGASKPQLGLFSAGER
jgi:type I restriction enzyme S subunit